MDNSPKKLLVITQNEILLIYITNNLKRNDNNHQTSNSGLLWSLSIFFWVCQDFCGLWDYMRESASEFCGDSFYPHVGYESFGILLGFILLTSFHWFLLLWMYFWIRSAFNTSSFSTFLQWSRYMFRLLRGGLRMTKFTETERIFVPQLWSEMMMVMMK